MLVPTRTRAQRMRRLPVICAARYASSSEPLEARMLLSAPPLPANLRTLPTVGAEKRLVEIDAEDKKLSASKPPQPRVLTGTSVAVGALAPVTPSPMTTIDGPDFDSNAATTGFYQIPPNANATAGPGHVVNVVSSTIQWSTKAGANLNTQRIGADNTGSATGSFFESLAPTTRTFDAKVVYDTYGGRFIVLAIEQTDISKGDAANASRVLLAVSQDSDPTHGWYFTSVNSKLTVNTRWTWLNFPGLSVDSGAIYITGNMTAFGNDPTQPNVFQGSRLLIVNKSGLYTGSAPASTIFYDPSAAAGLPVQAFTLQPALMYGAAPGSTGTFLVSSGYVSGATDFLSIIRVDNPLATPAFTNQFLSVGDIHNGTVGFPSAVPQKNSAITLDGGDLRVHGAVWRNNALWAVNDINPTTASDTANAGQLTAHWYKINTTTLSTLSLSDQGNVGGEDIAASTRTFYPSIAVDSSGDIGIGFSASGPNLFPSAAYTARKPTDSAGTVQASVIYAAGVDYYHRPLGGTSNRWGDYSSIAVDPAGTIFWAFNEYALARGTPIPLAPGEDGRWGTRLAAFTFATTGSITGQVFADNLSNGTFDGSDAGLVGQTVYLDADSSGTFNTGDISTTTTAGGNFTFTNVAPNTYTLREVVPAGHVQSGPAGNFYSVQVTIGGIAGGYTFANFPLSVSTGGGNDSITIQLNAGGTKFQVFFGPTLSYEAPASLPTSFILSAAGGDDTITIATSNGNPVPTGGISLDGGAQTGGDALTVSGTAGADSFTVTSGAVGFGGRTIAYSNTESLFIESGAGADDLVVNSGTVRLPAQTAGAGLLNRQFANLTIAPAANVILGTTALQSDRTSIVAAVLSISGAGKLDLSNNEMTVTSPATTVRGQIISAQIASTASGGVLGYNDLGAGVTRVRFTLVSDTNLDGTIDVTDLGNIASSYGILSGVTWEQGDSNYDGAVDVVDLGNLASGYSSTLN